MNDVSWKKAQRIITVATLIMLFNFGLCHNALAAGVSLEAVSANFTGDTNGVFNAGGSFGLTTTVTAINQTASSAVVTLTSLDPCVSISQGRVVYGNVSAGQNVSNSNSPFRFSISSLCPNGHLINLILTMAATGYSSSPVILPVLVNIPSIPTIAPSYTCTTNYYVSTNGSDANNGTSAAQAWYSIGHAITYLRGLGGTHGGVCVNVQPGTYAKSNYASSLSGTSDTPGGYLVFRSSMPHGATVQVPSADATGFNNSFRFDQARFIVIDGFNLTGQVVPNSQENGVCTNSFGTPGDHIKIINNLIHDHGGAGVGANHTDYLTVMGNIVFNNANTSPSEVSGISTWQAVASDTVAGFHNIISNNIVFKNAEVSDGHATHSDGNGIIIDDFRNTQNASAYGVYTPQSLVENNLVFGNGGRGVHVFLSDNVTVRNNTTTGNAQDPIGLGNWRSEIDVVNGANNTFINNIASAQQAVNIWNVANVSFLDASTNSSNTTNSWHNNLSFDGTMGRASTLISESTSTITAAQGNVLGQNPKFVNPGLNQFTLQAGSPAILSGTSAYGYPLNDLIGAVRFSSAIDMGAYQYSKISTYPLTVSNTGNGFGMVFGSTSTASNLINCGVNTGASLCSATLNSGTTITLTSAAASGSTFSGWSITGSLPGTCIGTISPCTVIVTATTNITANFSLAGEVIDTTNLSKVTTTGAWIPSAVNGGYYGTNYLQDGNAFKGTKSVKYTPGLAGGAGSYQVYIWYTADSNRATNVPVDIKHSGVTTTAFLNQKINGGTWVLLGTYNFLGNGSGEGATIRTTSTNGYVIADAIEFVQLSWSPTVSITSPAFGSSFNAGSNITISANASENNGIISTVAFYNGTKLIGAAKTIPYTYAWNNVAAGNYTLTAVATDIYGNSVTSSPLSVTSPEIIDTTTGLSKVSITGAWASSAVNAGYYGTNYLQDGNSLKGTKSIKYTPGLAGGARSYHVYIRYTSDTNRATNVPVDVKHSGVTTTVILNQQINGGTWVLLGTYNFLGNGSGEGVTIRTTSTNGFVIADTVEFI